MIIYKILRETEFLELEKNEQTSGSQKDQIDGFVHFSTKNQLPETLKTHFFLEERLILMAVETDKIKNYLKWEESRNDELFPHLYSKLTFADGLWFAPIELINGKHLIPPGT